MHTKTMEGLVGARRSMASVNTPMRVYRRSKAGGTAPEYFNVCVM